MIAADHGRRGHRVHLRDPERQHVRLVHRPLDRRAGPELVERQLLERLRQRTAGRRAGGASGTRASWHRGSLTTSCIPGIHTRYGDPARPAGAPRRGAGVRLPAQGGVRGAHRRHLAAQHRAGLHDAGPGRARRTRRAARRRRRRPGRLRDHRRRSPRGRHLVRLAGTPGRARPRRADHQARRGRHRTGRRRTDARADPALGDDADAAGADPAQDRRRRQARLRHGLAPRARAADLRRRGRGPVARPRRGAPAARRGDQARRPAALLRRTERIARNQGSAR